MNARIIGALISKDVTLFFRNRFFALITVLGVVVYLVIYFVMPASVDETLRIGVYAPVMPPAFEQIQEEGLEIEVVESGEALSEGVSEGHYAAGVELPADFMERLASGQRPRIRLYFTSDAPPELKEAVEVVIRELAYLQAGQPLPVEVSEVIIGPDMVGMQIPPRDRLRPLLAVFIIMIETFGLASLISAEVEQRTIQALLVTPMSVSGLFLAKGITGTFLAFSQAAVFMAAVGGMGVQPTIIVVTLLLGAVLATGVGFLMAALSKDLMSVMAWGVVALVVLGIPAFGVMFPGAISDWVKVIPSYYLVDTVHRVANFGAGWSDVWSSLLALLGFDLAIIWIGIMALRRKTG